MLSADKVSLTLAPDTVNTFTDGKAYTAAFEKQPNACICSRDDLVINGTGTLLYAVCAVLAGAVLCVN